jgi:hypothetical protein
MRCVHSSSAQMPAEAPSSGLPRFVQRFRDTEQFIGATGERSKQPAEHVKPGLLTSSLEFRDVGSMKRRIFGQIELRQARGFSSGSESLTEFPQFSFLGRRCHRLRILCACRIYPNRL